MATIAADAAAAPPRELSPTQRALRRLVRRRGAMVGLAVIVFFVALAILAPYIAPYDPLKTSWTAVRKAPSALYWFGTDEIGRDVLSRIIWGTRASLLAGVVSVCISLALGVPIGMLAGYVGGWVDALISRITDAMLACPFLILAIALAAFLGPSLTNAMIAIGITATRSSSASRAPRCCRSRWRIMSRRRGRSATRICGSHSATSCRTSWRRSSCRPRSPSPRR
jgi:peptide/nickel transport system permease protein